MSLPLWECGLKYKSYEDYKEDDDFVTPLVGVWIEILKKMFVEQFLASLPLWECGLKYRRQRQELRDCQVTPLVGVWIEMIHPLPDTSSALSHSPCGSVD